MRGGGGGARRGRGWGTATRTNTDGHGRLERAESGGQRSGKTEQPEQPFGGGTLPVLCENRKRGEDFLSFLNSDFCILTSFVRAQKKRKRIGKVLTHRLPGLILKVRWIETVGHKKII